MRVMRLMAVAAALALNLPAGACGGEDGDGGTGPGGGGGLSGDCTLEWVNEGGLPEDEPMSWGTAGFRGGSLHLSGDGAWEMKIDYEDLEQGEALTLHDQGDYDRDGSDLLFTSAAYNDEFEGEVDGDAVALVYDFDGDGDYETEFTFVK